MVEERVWNFRVLDLILFCLIKEESFWQLLQLIIIFKYTLDLEVKFTQQRKSTNPPSLKDDKLVQLPQTVCLLSKQEDRKTNKIPVMYSLYATN